MLIWSTTVPGKRRPSPPEGARLGRRSPPRRPRIGHLRHTEQGPTQRFDAIRLPLRTRRTSRLIWNLSTSPSDSTHEVRRHRHGARQGGCRGGNICFLFAELPARAPKMPATTIRPSTSASIRLRQCRTPVRQGTNQYIPFVVRRLPGRRPVRAEHLAPRPISTSRTRTPRTRTSSTGASSPTLTTVSWRRRCRQAATRTLPRLSSRPTTPLPMSTPTPRARCSRPGRLHRGERRDDRRRPIPAPGVHGRPGRARLLADPRPSRSRLLRPRLRRRRRQSPRLRRCTGRSISTWARIGSSMTRRP